MNLQEICNFLLISNILICFTNSYLVYTKKIRFETVKILAICSSFFVLTSFCILLCSFIYNDFGFELVAMNVSKSMPFLYKVSSLWSNYEGSFLLFLSQISILEIFFLYQNKEKFNLLNISYFVVFQYLMKALLSLFILFSANPFLTSSYFTEDGIGMNPVLQDFAVSIHPPIMYLGYSFSVIIFNYSLGILKNNSELKVMLNWSRACIFCLTLGVGLGSWWAYRELGWGGFWFFDPVENLSLTPLISAIAYHHFLLISSKQDKFIKWTIFFGMLIFLSVITSIFLIRSGLIISVHSFAFDKYRSYSLCAMLFLILGYSTNTYVKNIYKIKEIKFDGSVKEGSILISNIIWLFVIFLIFISVLYPILYEYLLQENVFFDEKFYINKIAPLVIPILLITNLSYRNTSLKYCKIVILALMSAIAICFSIDTNLTTKIFIISALILIFNTLLHFLIRSNFLKNFVNTNAMSMILGHVSFGFIVLSIIGNCIYKFEFEFKGKVNDSHNFNSMKVKLSDIRYSRVNNYVKQIAEFQVEYKNHVTSLKPELRWYTTESKMTSDADIFSFVLYDLYAVINNSTNDYVEATIYYRPFVSILWLSIVILCFATILRALKRQ